MSLPSRLSHLILILHSLANIAQGIYSLVSPRGYAALAGALFAGAPDKALQSIGLGAIGVGWYELVFVAQGNRALVLATMAMRVLFAGVMMGWEESGAVVYQLGVVVVCGVALWG